MKSSYSVTKCVKVEAYGPGGGRAASPPALAGPDGHEHGPNRFTRGLSSGSSDGGWRKRQGHEVMLEPVARPQGLKSQTLRPVPHRAMADSVRVKGMRPKPGHLHTAYHDEHCQ